jgi:hypothetical protein
MHSVDDLLDEIERENRRQALAAFNGHRQMYPKRPVPGRKALAIVVGVFFGLVLLVYAAVRYLSL